MSKKLFWLTVILVVLMAAVGQFANTIYVPAMHAMAMHFHVSAQSIQTLMVAYLLPYGLSQFAYGPISDLWGRRPTVLVGLGIYFAGSMLTVLGHSFDSLIYGCLCQGLGAGVGGVMARTVMKDCYSGEELYQANAIISLALIAAPLLAPIIGGTLTAQWGWHSNFSFLLIFIAIVWLAQWHAFPESNHRMQENRKDPFFFIHAYKKCFKHPTFLAYALCLALTFGCVAVFEASANEIFGSMLHYSTKAIGILFILPLMPYIAGTYLAKRMKEKLSIQQLMAAALAFIFLGALSLSIPAFALIINSTVVIIPIMITMFGAGLLFPTAVTGAMDPMGEVAGTAGAILGGLQNLGAAAMTYGFASISQTTQRPLALVFDGACLLIALLFFTLLLSPGKENPASNASTYASTDKDQ